MRKVVDGKPEAIKKNHDMVLTHRKLCLAFFNVNPEEFQKRGRNIDSLQHNGYQKESGWKHAKYSALITFKREKGKNNQQRILHQLIELVQRRSHSDQQKNFFHQDYVRVVGAEFNDLAYELLPNLSYSPGLAPSDYFLF